MVSGKSRAVLEKIEQGDTSGLRLRQAAAFLISPRSLCGLLIGCLYVSFIYLLSLLIMPGIGEEIVLGAGIMKPLDAGLLLRQLNIIFITLFLCITLIAAPVIVYAKAKSRTSLKSFIRTMWAWVLIVWLSSLSSFFLEYDPGTLIVVVLPCLFIALWIVAVIYWGVALKEVQEKFSLSMKVKMLCASLIWFYFIITVNSVMMTD